MKSLILWFLFFCDFERENHKSEIFVFVISLFVFVILKGQIINLKFVFVIFVFVCDFGPGMMGRGVCGLKKTI